MIAMTVRIDTAVDSIMFTKIPFHLALRCSTQNINETSDASEVEMIVRQM